MVDATIRQVLARYKEKKVSDKGNPIYLYSERQVALRKREKAERLEKLRSNITTLRSQVRKDLKSSDPDIALTALAVALIDHTYERVGNQESAAGDSNEDGEEHFGVTTWKKDHVSFGKGKATIRYVGKSGVKQKKTVTDKAILTALRNAYEGCEDESLFCYASGKVDAKRVNTYLKRFGVTAKDLRGYHSNAIMKETLKKIRAKGGDLPKDKKEREKKLKNEFKKALEEVAKRVGGHEPSTLKNQYLVPSIERDYLKDGTVSEKMKTASQRVAERFAAESLTKEWLMGVRRGWAKLMKPTIRDWDDVHAALQSLEIFVERLKDQVFFVRRGPYTGTPTMTEGAKVATALDQLLEAVKEAKRRSRFWQDVHEGKTPHSGTFKIEEGQQMLDLYRKDFPEATTTALETSRGKWRNVKLTELLDKALKILREDAQRIKRHDDQHPDTPYERDRSVYKEFDLYGMKVVVNDATVLPGDVKQYVKYIDEAYQRLKQKGFGKSWYGMIYLECRTCGGTNPHGAELGVGGTYTIPEDAIRIFSRPNSHIPHLIVHEIGHRYWFKNMSQAQRGKFESLVKVYPYKKPDIDVEMIPETKIQEAKTAVKNTVAPLQMKLKEFAAADGKRFRDILKAYSQPLVDVTRTLSVDISSAVQKDGAWDIQDNSVKRLLEDVGDVAAELTHLVRGMDQEISARMRDTPEPAKAPNNLDKYWLDVFKPIRAEWVAKAEHKIEELVASAYIAIDARVKTHNDQQRHTADKLLKDWKDKWDADKRPVLPVSEYGSKHIDEAWAEVFADYVMGKDLTRDQIESFKSVLASQRIGDRDVADKTGSTRSSLAIQHYKQALVVTPASVDKWRKDLRLMTKIYKSIDPDGGDRALELWNEAKKLFLNFRNNFEHWIYKVVLAKDEDSYYGKILKKEAWDALFHISTDTLFPRAWDSQTKTYKPALWELRNQRERAIKRYQTSFNKAFGTLQKFLETHEGERYEDQYFEVSGINVLVKGYGRGSANDEEALEKTLRKLRTFAQIVSRAGFKNTVQGLNVVVDMANKESLTNGVYKVSEDRIVYTALGLYGESGETFVHELGHRFWFKEVPSQARAYWEEVMESRGVKVTREDVEDFHRLVLGWIEDDPFLDSKDLRRHIDRLPISAEKKAVYYELSDMTLTFGKGFDPDKYKDALSLRIGDTVLIEEISEYAASGGPIEAFAEAFRLYVVKGPGALGPFTRELFKKVVRAGGVRMAHIVAARSRSAR